MGQEISYCNGSFEPHAGERRRRILPYATSKSLVIHHNDDNTALSRATASTRDSFSKTSSSPPSPLGSNTSTENENTNANANGGIVTGPNHLSKHIHEPVPLRYTTSTRNLKIPPKEVVTTTDFTAKTVTPLTHPSHPRADQKQQQHCIRGHHGFRNNRRKVQSMNYHRSLTTDKRSRPVKFPDKGQTYGYTRHSDKRKNNSDNLNDSSHSQESPQGASYLERMYDSRTWEMYVRIISHREKVEAFNAANASANRNENDDDRNSTNQTYMSDPVQRVTNSSTMEGGVDYDNFYETATDDDDNGDSRGMGAFMLEDHSAPPHHQHRQCDNGHCHHQHHSGCYAPNHNYHQHSNAETYSEWEHMYGDDVGNDGDPCNHHPENNTHGGQHQETIFVFDL